MTCMYVRFTLVCEVTLFSFFPTSKENWTTLVQEDEKDVLEWAACVKQNLLVLCYLHDVKVNNEPARKQSKYQVSFIQLTKTGRYMAMG